MTPDILILGCGFTGRRVARRLLGRGARVTATSRDPESLTGLGVHAIALGDLHRHLRPGMLVVHSIPPAGPSDVTDRLGDAPARIVYLSSTAVYGAATRVDSSTPVDWSNPKARERLEAEARITSGAWSSLILRPAAIYGPGRGAHVSMRRGSYVPGPNIVSRIHVEDLAAHVEAALFVSVTGAFPVADEEPCTSREIAEFCARVLHLPMPDTAVENPTARRLTDRWVDGAAIRRILGIRLIYPTFREGIPAAMNALSV